MNQTVHSLKKRAAPSRAKPEREPVPAYWVRGRAAGVFRKGIDMIDLHMSISARSVFNVANRHTFSLIFQREPQTAAAFAVRRNSIVDMVVRHVCK